MLSQSQVMLRSKNLKREQRFSAYFWKCVQFSRGDASLHCQYWIL